MHTSLIIRKIIFLLSVSIVKSEDQVIPASPSAVFEGLLILSTIDGYLRAIEPHSGTIKWSLKEEPVLKSPKTVQHSFTFLPDPQDGGLYVLKDSQLKKLPYSIPQLVTASPCRTTDGVLYAGSKRDVWLEIDPATGLKLHELSLAHTDRQCPLSKNATFFIGRSEYKLTMFDPENKDRQWNATFTDYSSHLLSADPSYPYQHLTSAVDGRVVAVNGLEGSIVWELDVGATVVAMYLLQKDGLHKLPYTVFGKETLEEFVKEPWQKDIQTWVDDVSNAQFTEATTRNLFPTLYVGENIYGLFAMPAFVNGRTVTIAPKYLGPPLLEGPTPIAIKDEKAQPMNSPSTRPTAFINLNIAKITHKTVDGEFLVLGYHELPQLAPSQLLIRRHIRTQYPSLTFVDTDKRFEKAFIRVSDDDDNQRKWSIYALWKRNLLSATVTTISATLLFLCICWIICKMVKNIERKRFVKNEARLVQTTKSLGTFWRARRMHQLPHGWLQAGNIMYNPDDRLGHGCEGTVVFRGKFDGREVAVKRVIADIQLADREVDLLRESDTHPHVIRYFCMESDSNFRYIALELCDYSLFDYVEGAEIREQCQLTATNILLQATKGLAYLHSINIVHRDMKPQNVLLSKSTKHGGVRALISDFGLCKRLKTGRISLSRRSGLIGTDGWIAPEALTSDTSVTCAVDVFSLGCIYYYVLTNGAHPFGDVLKRQANIMQGEYSLGLLNTTDNQIGVSLIDSMLQHDPQKRPTSAALSMHPFFWSEKKQLQFFLDVSDRIEKLDERSLEVRRLEENAHCAIGYNWRQSICMALAEDLRKFRTYKGNSVRDLLRAMRNKKHHYRELPSELRESLGQIPEEFVTYFTNRFPKLLQHTYEAMICCANEHAFIGYYSDEARKMVSGLVNEGSVAEEKSEVRSKMAINDLKIVEDESGFIEVMDENIDDEWIEVSARKTSMHRPKGAAESRLGTGSSSQHFRRRRRHTRNKIELSKRVNS